MPNENHYLTTKAYSEKTGISVSEIARRLREGKIKGVKKSGRWMIPVADVDEKVKSPAPKTESAISPAKAGNRPTAGGRGRSFSVSDFSEITYLTETGVLQWLKSGRLQGEKDEKGGWRVNAANLETPDIKRLIR